MFWLTCCAVTSSRTKSNLEEKGFLSLTSRREVRAETQGGAWRQEVKQRPRGTVLCWFAVRGLLSLLSYPSQDHLPRGGTVHSGLSPPIPIINQENDTQACLQGNPMRRFLNWVFLFPDGSGLCQVEKKNQPTESTL